MRASPSLKFLPCAAFLLAGCANRETSDDGSTATAASTAADDAGEDDGGDTDEGDVATPVVCPEVPPQDCMNAEGCVTVFGSEVVIEDSGTQYCGDLGFPIGCANEGCEELEYAIMCTPDDPPELFLAIAQCLPQGWSLCPNQTCG